MALRPATQNYYQRGHQRVTAPALEPISTNQLRTYLKVDDVTLPTIEANDLITQARDYIENKSGLALIDQVWRLSLDRWPGHIEPWWDGLRQMPVSELTRGSARPIFIPRFPLVTIDSITVYNEASVATSVSVASTFDVDTQQMPGRIALKFGQTWPIASRAINAIEIVYTAGYGETQNDVPATLQRAVLSFAAYLYDHRGECDLAEAYKKSGAESFVATYSSRSI